MSSTITSPQRALIFNGTKSSARVWPMLTIAMDAFASEAALQEQISWRLGMAVVDHGYNHRKKRRDNVSN